MSSIEPTQPADASHEARQNLVENVAGLFAAASLFVSLVALAYHPLPLTVASALLALVASGMSTRYRLLCAAALAVAGICFIGGLVIAIVTNHSLW